jgi:hypothetical protein
MMKRSLQILTLFAFCALSMPGAFAEEPRTLSWEDLAVKVGADNPIAKLSDDQIREVGTIAGLRARKAAAGTLSPEEAATEKEALTKLKQEGIDADALLAKHDAFVEKTHAAARTVNSALDGEMIRMPGYMLPLEFSGTKVTEFLLVPWVGACIHTPPPEPNQIVYVKTDKAFEMQGMFDAVWVAGRIAAAGSKRAVTIVDGSADIDVGYSLHASLVEPYRK